MRWLSAFVATLVVALLSGLALLLGHWSVVAALAAIALSILLQPIAQR